MFSRTILRIIVATLAITAVLAWAAGPIADALLPWYRLQIGLLAPEYQILAIEGQKKQADTQVMLAVNIKRPVLAQGRLIMPDPRGRAEASTLAWAPLQSIAIVAAMLIAWPARRMREHLWRWLAGAPLLALLLSFDVPVTLIGSVRDFYDPGNLPAAWAGLMARGGRLALAVSLALAAIALAARIGRGRPHGIAAAAVMLAGALFATATPEVHAIVGGAGGGQSVTAYAAWIDATIAAAEQKYAVSEDIPTLPEWGMLLLGLLLLGRLRQRGAA